KRRRLAERIADNNELVRQLKQLQENQQQLQDLQRTACEVTELYQREKEQRSELERRWAADRERCADLEKQLDVQQLNCEQLQEELRTKGLPVDAKEMVSIFLQLTQRIGDESHASGLLRREHNLIRKLKDYCKSAKISIPLAPIRSPTIRRTKAPAAVTQATQATQTAAPPEPPKMSSIGVQSVQLKATRDQGTQHKNTTTTRGTTTASFIKMHDVGTCFPEPKPPLSAQQILDKMLSWNNKTFITPLSPIHDDLRTETLSPIPDDLRPETETASAATCTDLCNVQREIDYMPELPAQLKRSNSRPPSRGSIKDEVTNPMGSYGHHMARELLNFLPQNQSVLANLPPHVFEEIWQVMGQMVLLVLQRRSSNSTLTTPTHAPPSSKADFSWLDALYESSLNQAQSSKGEPKSGPKSAGTKLTSGSIAGSDFETAATSVEVGTDPKEEIPPPPPPPPLPPVELELTPIRLPIKPKLRAILKPKRKPKRIRRKRLKAETKETTESAVHFLSNLSSFHNLNCDNLDIELDEEERQLLQLTSAAASERDEQLSKAAETDEQPAATVEQLQKVPQQSAKALEKVEQSAETVEQWTRIAAREQQQAIATAAVEQTSKSPATVEQQQQQQQATLIAKQQTKPAKIAATVEHLTTATADFPTQEKQQPADHSSFTQLKEYAAPADTLEIFDDLTKSATPKKSLVTVGKCVPAAALRDYEQQLPEADEIELPHADTTSVYANKSDEESLSYDELLIDDGNPLSVSSSDLIIDDASPPSDNESVEPVETVEHNQIASPELPPLLPSNSKRKRKSSSSSSDSLQPAVKRLTRLQAKQLLNWEHEAKVEANNMHEMHSNSFYSPMSPSPVAATDHDASDSEAPIEIPLEPPGGAENAAEPMALLSYVVREVKRCRRNPRKQQPKKEYVERLQLQISNYLKGTLPLEATLSTADESLVMTAVAKAYEQLEESPPTGDVLGRLLALLGQCENRSCAFAERFMHMLEKRLFHPKERLAKEVTQKLLRLYLQLIGVQASFVVPGHNYANPARLLLAKILYHYKEDMPSLVLEVLCHFPTVLPHREERDYDNSDALITVIKHLLMSQKYEVQDAAGPDRALLSKLRFEYHFQPFEPSKQQVIENLVEKVKAGRLHQLCYAFALFCKRSPMPQVIKDVLETQLVPLANSYCDLGLQSEEYDARMECLLQCISMIVKQVPLDHNLSIASYIELFKRLLVAVPRPGVQQAAVQAILRTQRFGYAFALDALQSYRPNYPLTAMTRAMLRSFAERRRQYQ
ncbi:hypothetical protein KR222_010881, partial [Zaprionus bogoriensis]